MALVRRSHREGKADKTARPKPRVPEAVMELPMEMEEAGGDLDDFAVLIHGEKKIGKTSLSLQTDDPDKKVLCLQFDPPQIAYRRMEIVCPSMNTFMRALKALEQKAADGEFPYARIVVDRADTWFKYAEKLACQNLAIEHPSEETWGKGWAEVRKIFTEAVDRILRLPCGKWFLCHSDWKEVETRTEKKIQRLLPNLSGTADEILNGKVDAWFAYTYDEKKRVLVLQGDERTGAGHRINGHFLQKDGSPLESISMGNSEQEGYSNLVAAFNNQYRGESEPRVKPTAARVRVRARAA